jgi:beta-glucosidase
MSAGGSAPFDNTAKGWTEMCKQYQDKAKTTRMGIPILYGVDAVHGHNNLDGAVIFPHNIGLGAANDTALMTQIGNVTAKELRATGVNWNFAPCIAVGTDERWGRTYESYGENVNLVSKLAVPYIKALQSYGVTACAKHYVADGATKWGTGDNGFKIDRGNAVISEKELRDKYLPAYRDAIKAGVKSVMVSYSSVNGVKNHANKYLIQKVLKDELGFKGFVVSDYEAIHEIKAKDFHGQVVTAINSGIDMLMEPNIWQQTIDEIKDAVKKGEIKQERINDAAGRILKVKLEMKVFQNPLGNQKSASEGIGSKSSKDIARKAVRESLVLLKNKNNILPIKKGVKVFITGPAANDMGVQCGGWTKTWQGDIDANNGTKCVKGTTILEGFQKMAKQNGGTIITDVKQAKKAQAAVVVIGERPYAEGAGDDESLGLYDGTALGKNEEALKTAKATGLPVIVILVSGRPRIVTNEINNWAAFVEAWLPGSEGDGVAEVLYGKYNFSGKLPVTWAKSVTQIPINVGSMDKKTPLFQFGFGLRYK